MSSRAEKAAALERQIAARRGGAQVITEDDFKVAPVFDVKSEEEYNRLKSERRKTFVTGKGA